MSSTNEIMLCPHCGNRTPHRTGFSRCVRVVWYDSEGVPVPGDGPELEYVIWICSTCDHFHMTEDCPEDSHSRATIAFPHGVALPQSVPDAVRTCYTEAAPIRNMSPNGYAVLIRRAMEALCEDRGVSKRTLAKGLEELAARGEIPPVLSEMTTVLRQLGNAGAHFTDQVVTVPDTWTIDSFFRSLIEYVYVAPGKLEEFKSRLAARNKQHGEGQD